MNIKRLNLEYEHEVFVELYDPSRIEYEFIEMPPLIKRDGWYMIGDFCWFEYQGKAFECASPHHKRNFRFRLKVLNAYEIDSRIIKTLDELSSIDHSYLSPEQIEIMRCWHFENNTRINLRSYLPWLRSLDV